MAFIPNKLGSVTRTVYGATPDEAAAEATRVASVRAEAVAAIRVRNGVAIHADEAAKKNIAVLQAAVATLETTRLAQAERLPTVSADLKEASDRLDAANIRVGYAAPAQTGWLRSQDPEQGAAQMAVNAMSPAVKAAESALATTDAALPAARAAAASAKAAYKPLVLESEELPETFGQVPAASDTVIRPLINPARPDIIIVGPGVVTPFQPIVPATPTVNPYSSLSEAQLRAELAAVESAVYARQSKGLSAGYEDLTIIDLLQKKALIMAALTPILIKKYGLYAAGGLTALLIVKILIRRRS